MRSKIFKIFKIFILMGEAPSFSIASRKVIKKPFLAIIFLLTGCMGSTFIPAQLKTEFIDLELCRAAIFHGVGSVENTNDVIAEINRRDLISSAEWLMINTSTPQSKKLKVGMSECSMLLVMNNNSYQITETVSEFGVNRLYEYGHNGYGPYIFVDNNKITSWTF